MLEIQTNHLLTLGSGLRNECIANTWLVLCCLYGSRAKGREAPLSPLVRHAASSAATASLSHHNSRSCVSCEAFTTESRLPSLCAWSEDNPVNKELDWI